VTPGPSSAGSAPELARPLAAAVFASGSGSNFQALADLECRGAPWRIRLLITDRAGVGAIDRADRAGVASRVVPCQGREQSEVGSEMLEALRALDVQVVFLAGYLRLVPPSVVEAYRRRILNVHPALLPSFGGKGMYGRRVHEAVLASGCQITGPTVHFVDEHYDEGTIYAQWPVPVLLGDSPETLAARVLSVEHLLYPLAAARLCRALASGADPTPLLHGGEAFSLTGGPGSGQSLQTLFDKAFPDP